MAQKYKYSPVIPIILRNFAVKRVIAMIVFPNAKINLGLNIVSRRPDGYHDLLTIFYPVGRYAGTPSDSGRLADIIEITPSTSDTDSMKVTGRHIDCHMHDNLVWKALQLFRKSVPDLPTVDIKLEKHLPDGAGMGGGSADASFTLRALNEIAGNPITMDDLARMALNLGADCPFFIYNTPCIGTGTGEILTPVSLDLGNYTLAVLKPSEGISTRDAFARITPFVPTYTPEKLLDMPVEQWRDRMTNDFEQPMFALHPELREIKEYLYESGAVYASMTGSGSAFYGLFNNPEKARQCACEAPTPFTAVSSLFL